VQFIPRGERQGWSLGPRLANGVTLLLAWPLLLLAVLAALVCGLLPDPDAKLLEHWQDVRKVTDRDSWPFLMFV